MTTIGYNFKFAAGIFFEQPSANASTGLVPGGFKFAAGPFSGQQSTSASTGLVPGGFKFAAGSFPEQLSANTNIAGQGAEAVADQLLSATRASAARVLQKFWRQGAVRRRWHQRQVQKFVARQIMDGMKQLQGSYRHGAVAEVQLGAHQRTLVRLGLDDFEEVGWRARSVTSPRSRRLPAAEAKRTLTKAAAAKAKSDTARAVAQSGPVQTLARQLG
jgi:hypothetical protein